ncbi:uncharacterized protein LOC134540090 isoform X1 [Bacillus rossius redtenbacheri]|uniref:uncharacterized protein LOC134540090 isoform X1 n=1 Tax=Bacillus rossius redtenbacheri TaxID=93214 RepID=UPI002FDE3677
MACKEEPKEQRTLSRHLSERVVPSSTAEAAAGPSRRNRRERTRVGEPRRSLVSPQLLPLEPDEAMYTHTEMVLVRRMPRDGDSLFAALALQLEGVSIGSRAHAHLTTSVRHQTTFHMKRNQEQFFKPLLRAVCVYGNRYIYATTDEERVLKYVQDLANPGFPAGPEVIPAVSYVYDVDVSVYQEAGITYLVSASPQPHLKAAIAHRVVWEGEGRLKDYFDVVVSVYPKRYPVPHGLRVAT